jgi:phosphoglycerol transferase MdoB-like AlkP superfamily enzyme
LLLLNFPFVLLNVGDIPYFNFTGRRSNISLLGIASDLADQSLSLSKLYWYYGLLDVILFVIIAWFLLRKRLVINSTRQKSILTYIIMLIVCVLAMRGSFGLKPLRINNAFTIQNNTLGNASLNSSFTFIHSLGQKGLKKLTYLPDKQVHKVLFDTVSVHFEPPQNLNIVLLIVESLSYEFLKKGAKDGVGYTPFIDLLVQKGYFFNNHYANGRESIDALPALFASIPRFMDRPYGTSVYQGNTLDAMPKQLLEKGYSTHFFHGARNGSMGFDSFSKMAGIQYYYGLNEYSNMAEFDGTWGIPDEPYLQYVNNNLKTFKTPFFSAIFTLSSHTPYTIPAKYKGKFKKGPHAIYESIGYTDYALKQFFESAQKEAWFNNTFFILTGDHVHPEKHLSASPLPLYHVPLLFYTPNTSLNNQLNKYWPKEQNSISQHLDLMPTLLSILGKNNVDKICLGRNLLKNSNPKAIVYNQGIFSMYKNDSLSFLNSNRVTSQRIVSIKGSDKTTFSNEIFLKASIQHYTNGLINNNL